MSAKKNIKILFINPVIRVDDKPRHIPYGMAQLAAICKNKKYKIQVLDANAWRSNDNQLCDVLKLDSWDVIATGGLVTTYGYIKKCVQYARKLCPQALIIAGGGFLSPIPHEIMSFLPEIDIGVIGEGVVTFPEVLDRFSEGSRDFSQILGIVYRDAEGKPHLAGQRPLLDNLDSLPFPAYELFPMDIYFKNSSILMSEEAMQARRRIDLMASCGCQFRCKFCFHLGLSGEIEVNSSQNHLVFSNKRIVRMHSPEYVIDHIKFVRKKYNIDFVSFIDENFVFLDKLTKGKWTSRFFKLWEKEDLVPKCIRNSAPHSVMNCQGIHWGTTAHASLVSLELLKRMRRMGCSYLDYGFESFSDEILKSIGKSATAEINERALKWTIQTGIRPIPNQMIGFPDESFESLRMTMEAWKKLGIKSYPFFATPYPGSEWFFEYRDKILNQYGGNLEEFLLDLGNATKITAVISKKFNAVELLGLRELMVTGNEKLINEYEKQVS